MLGELEFTYGFRLLADISSGEDTTAVQQVADRRESLHARVVATESGNQCIRALKFWQSSDLMILLRMLPVAAVAPDTQYGHAS